MSQQLERYSILKTGLSQDEVERILLSQNPKDFSFYVKCVEAREPEEIAFIIDYNGDYSTGYIEVSLDGEIYTFVDDKDDALVKTIFERNGYKFDENRVLQKV